MSLCHGAAILPRARPRGKGWRRARRRFLERPAHRRQRRERAHVLVVHGV